MLKTIKLFFVFVLILCLSACGDDEDSTSTDLVGTWAVETFDVNIENSVEVLGITTSIVTDIESTIVDYEISFTASDFTTEGGYSYDITSLSNGIAISETTETVSNVSGTGTYTTSGDEIIINGSFFEFESAGVDFSALQGEQTANFSINGNTLTITQDEEMTTEIQGTTSVVNLTSTSVWTRQ